MNAMAAEQVAIDRARIGYQIASLTTRINCEQLSDNELRSVEYQLVDLQDELMSLN